MQKDENPNKIESFTSKVRRLTREKGVGYVVLAGVRKIPQRLQIPSYNYYKFFKSWRTFTFQKKKYKYFYHKANTTWRNERAIEVPIIWEMVKSSKGSILEVGNVLSHYFSFKHDIVDKYEKAEGVINEDIADFHATKKYNLIVSISTLEHVGWDENPVNHEILGESEKVLRTIDSLRGMLASNGKIVVTVPLGYNPYLDGLIKGGKLKFDKQFYMKRISKETWIETDWENVEEAKFEKGIPSANALMIGVIEA